MKKTNLLLVVLVLLTISGNAQNRVTVRATVGDDLRDLLTTNRYFFAEFQEAEVFLVSTRTRAKMNFDMFSGEMMFIAQSDTLALTNVRDVRSVVFENHTFKPSQKGFVEVIAYNPDNGSELVVKHNLNMTSERRDGAYGTTSAVSSVTSFTQFTQTIPTTQEGNVGGLSISRDVTFRKSSTYYLVPPKGKLRLANRSGFLKAYSKRHAEVVEYLQQSPVDFASAADVLRLYIFCEE